METSGCSFPVLLPEQPEVSNVNMEQPKNKYLYNFMM